MVLFIDLDGFSCVDKQLEADSTIDVGITGLVNVTCDVQARSKHQIISS